MNENQLFVSKEYKSDNPLFTDIDFLSDSSFKECHNNHVQNFKYECVNDFKLTNITINERLNSTIIYKNITLDGLYKKLKDARQNGFIFNQINKSTKFFFAFALYKQKLFWIFKHRCVIDSFLE